MNIHDFLFLFQFRCTQCSTKFEYKNNLTRHIRNVHAKNIPRFTCPHCGRTCSTWFNLQAHCRDQHPGSSTPAMDECRAIVSNTKKLQIDRMAKKGQIKRPEKTCNECGETCKGTYNLNRHIERFHK